KTSHTSQLCPLLYTTCRAPHPRWRRAKTPCADAVAPRALRPEIGPYPLSDFHADTADAQRPTVAPAQRPSRCSHCALATRYAPVTAASSKLTHRSKLLPEGE